MFYYTEPDPLIITSSADTLLITTNTNTSLASTVNISAGGTGIETITAVETSDPTGQFTRSPTSFFLTGSGATQVFTITFNAGGVAGTYNAIYTLTGRGASKVINVTGIATTPAPPPPPPPPPPVGPPPVGPPPVGPPPVGPPPVGPPGL